MLNFIFADLRRNWIGVTILVLLVAFATALGVAVTLQERALRLGSARAAAPFDVVIGAPGSETQLVLSSIFLQPAPLQLLPSQTLAALHDDPRVELVAPVGFGDFVAGYPIVGTTDDAIRMLGGLKTGTGFDHMGDAVIGAHVGREIGDTFHPFHGNVGEPGEVHDDVEYKVVGRLAESGTPWDRAILVPIQSVWKTHEHHDHEDQADGHDHAHDDHEGHEHGEHDHGHESEEAAHGIDDAALTSEDNPGVPAIIVKPKTIADAYNIRQEYRAETTVAVFPGEVLTRLYGTLGDARRILSWVATGAQTLVGAAILMVIAVHVLQRRRQIGALRAFGAPRAVVLGIVWLEVFAVLAAGLLMGFALGYGIVQAISQRFTVASGIAMPVEFASSDLRMLLLFMVIGAVATLVPAFIAFRQSPAQALRL